MKLPGKEKTLREIQPTFKIEIKRNPMGCHTKESSSTKSEEEGDQGNKIDSIDNPVLTKKRLNSKHYF
jgi:hypothetical protein